MGWWTSQDEGGNRRHGASITALEQRLDTLERGQRSLKLEWEDVYDRLMKAAARLNARTRRAAADEASPEPVERPTPGNLSSLGTHEILQGARNRRQG